MCVEGGSWVAGVQRPLSGDSMMRSRNQKKEECGFSTRNEQRIVKNKNGKIGRKAHA